MNDVREDFPEEAVADRPSLAEGDRFRTTSEYQLVRRLGSGGMGEVWHAHRLSAGGHRHDVALKFVLMQTAGVGAELMEEALRISELCHDNIVGFVDSGRTEGGSFYVAMEFVRGLDLDGLKDLHGVGPERVARADGAWRVPCPLTGFVLFMVCRALHHAHTRRFSSGDVGLVHRDISPGNVLVEQENGFVKLTDFGVAATARAASGGEGGFSGKIPYAAPEVLYGEDVDERADIYSLGLVGYELMTGFNPNRALQPISNPMAQLSHVLVGLDEPIVPPERVIDGTSPELGRIVLRMLERDPAARYRKVDDVMRDLRVFLFGRGIGPTTDSFRDYLRIMRDPDCCPDDLVRSGLVFLCDRESGDLRIPLAWKPTPEALARIRAGVNPARGL